ncbi:MAG: cyclic nucleotide-binding domain-containing protein [Verrucomicrobiota bacterium]|jgi:CRP-like cAMP-binding protein|nr:cyclic nucleotide-binding domain-containing protein [Verrucomicrobiota bacterium]MDD8050697.1 cyclic nucleotide-binding domain-containing protein [Verrucomicrobiota bacterium]MDI9382875.1 cyclic nucleotide-binding domain-containing protein [Verrucomicrobiota bacterium]
MWNKQEFNQIKQILVTKTFNRHAAAQDCAVALICKGTKFRFGPGEAIFEEDEFADGIIYIILKGEKFRIEEEGERIPTNDLGPGKFLGEGVAVQRMNRLKSDPLFYTFKRRATVTPEEEAILLAWHWDDFRETVSSFLGEQFIDDLKNLIWARAHQ